LEEYDLAEESLLRATVGNPKDGSRLWYLAVFYLLNGEREKMYAPLGSALAADSSLLRSAVPFVVKTETPPERIDQIWPATPSARLRLLQGLRLHRTEEKRRYLAFALDQWRRILSGGSSPTIKDGSFFIRDLLGAGEVKEARRQWVALAAGNDLADSAFESGSNEIWNGGFELPLSGGALGWRLGRLQGVSIARAEGKGQQGSAALSVEFAGDSNLDFRGFAQSVFVRPGSTYRLSFDARVEDLTTDQGLYFEVFARTRRGPLLETERLLGTEPWRGYSSSFVVPEDTRAVTLRLRRKRSRRIDSRIQGMVVLDNVVLVSAEGESQL